MLLIGLTGSIATGKSTVSTMLSQPPYSLPIIDADLLARSAVDPGTRAYHAIISHFGPTTPDLLLPIPSHSSSSSTPEFALPSGNSRYRGRPLNRPALARRVFGVGTSGDRHVLNRIVHPAVRRLMLLAVLHAYVHGHWAVVLDVPLLFESGLDLFCGIVVVVGVREKETQVQRILKRDKELGGEMSEGQAWDRVSSQGDVAGKVERVRARGMCGGM